MPNTVLVAGAGPTIGAATAHAFHEAGYDVGLFARSAERIEALADEVGENALAVPVDVTDADAVEAGVEQVRERLGPVEVLVLNAAAGGGHLADRADLATLRRIFEVRVAGSLACVQAALPDLRATGGTVLFSGTTYAAGEVPEQVEWGAVAPAAEGLATSLAAGLEGVGVTYVRIGDRVVPAEEAGLQGALCADEVAARYLALVEGPGRSRVVDLYAD